MEIIKEFIDIVLNLREHIGELISDYGPHIYTIFFVVVFCETGLVLTPFLPGDSLLFTAGAFAALGELNIWFMFVLLSVAAVLGDTVNYWIGHYLGPKVFQWKKSRLFNPEHLRRTHAFYEKYGGKTIILARFVPIIRTFAPFVAGIGAMTYSKFIFFNITGGIAWVAICLFAGYWFGNLPWVARNFELVIVAIILISVLPMFFELLKARSDSRRQADAAGAPERRIP
jgi:membrane-associated protein